MWAYFIHSEINCLPEYCNQFTLHSFIPICFTELKYKLIPINPQYLHKLETLNNKLLRILQN